MRLWFVCVCVLACMRSLVHVCVSLCVWLCNCNVYEYIRACVSVCVCAFNLLDVLASHLFKAFVVHDNIKVLSLLDG